MDNTLAGFDERLSESNWSAGAGYPGGALQQWTAPYSATVANGGAATAAASSNNNNNSASSSTSSLASSVPSGGGASIATASQPSRVVVIHRDERGFGFVVAGDNPVFVQTVREGGAAERAGIVKDDIIIKVNGSWVTQSNHAEVVDLIRAGGSCVALTVVSPVFVGTVFAGNGVPVTVPQVCSNFSSTGMPSSPSSSGFGSPNLTPPPPPPPVGITPSRGLHHQPSIHRSVGITSPQPVGHEQQRVVELERLNTFKLMLEKEQQFVETKRSELTRGYNPPGAVELANAEKRVRELQQKYNQMAHRLGLSTSESQPQLSTIQTRSPPANRPQSTYYTGGGGGGRVSGRSRPGAAEGGGWDNLGCDVPPPLPARNRSLVAQVSVPILTASTTTMAAPLNPPPSELATSPPPPPLPPRNPSSASASSTSSSSSSSASSNSTYPSMPDVVPSGPGASGADLLHHQRTAGQQRDSPSNQSTCSSGNKRPNPSPLPSHHRTKSSPFPFAVQPVAATTPDTRRFSSSDSISELDATAKRTSNSKDTDSPTHGTPPGTPPPPYRRPVSPLTEDANGAENSAATASGPAPTSALALAYSPVVVPTANQQAPSPGVLYTGQETQLPIMPMEDDDFSDHESGLTDLHNIFKTLATLWQHNAHLAVFINFVISNCDPASLFFHMITDLYKEGTAKDMKKWAYEIHSTYLVPNAPLKVTNVDEHVLHEIDDALQVDIDKEEILRKVFWKARAKAKEEIKRQLADFRSKMSAGLNTMYGPNDAALDETLSDKSKELKVVEGILVPKLESFSDDLENSSDRNLAISASLATILQKHFNVKSPAAISSIERYPTFVSKEKSIKPKFLSKNKKQLTAKGHHFVAHQYFSVTQCNHCGNVLWGISPQGYLCTNCEMNIHKGCVRIIEESCIGAIHRKERGNDRISKIVDRFRPERELRRKLTPQDKARRDDKDSMDTSMTGSLDSDSTTGDKQTGPGSGSNGRSFTDGSRDRRSGTGSGSDSFGESDRRAGYTPPNEEELDSSLSTTNKKKVSRSESLRERAQRKHREKRKHSDPNLPPSHSSDMDRDDRSLSYNNSGSSSNSSLSTSLESPSPSDIVSNSRVSGSALSDGSSGVSVALSGTSITSLGAGAERGGAGSNVQAPWDSDIEADPDPPDWTRNLDADVVEKMTTKEKQRQEVINELFHTERSHVRNLKVLERVFYRPLLDNGFSDLVNLLFPNLPEMLEIHGRFNAMMKARKRDQPAVEAVGDILLAMFDGSSGESFQQAAATFCKYQSVALENLRDRRKKESKLQAFLAEAEGNPVCRRLQLQDIIPTAMQRLTKYPLLLESLAKYTQPRSDEMVAVRKSLERARDILNKVNQAVKEADNYNRLVDIQRRLDKSAFDKTDHPIANELKNFELTKHRLIYEGALTWRTKGQKNVDLHVVLLEEYILLLQKQDDKYVLKFHSINFLNSKEESKFTHSPIIKIATVLVRPVATDKLALFLVNTSPTGAQIYDLVAVSIAERKAWFRHITDATEAYKAREGRNRRPDGSPALHLSGPSLSSSSSSAQLAPTAENPEKTSKDDEATDDNVSGDSGVSLTPSSGENPATAESTSSASGAAGSACEPQPPQPPPHSASSSDGVQSEVAKKTGDGTGTPSSGSTSPATGSAAASPAPQRRLQRVEILKIAEGTPLIDPAEVVVSQGAVLTAEPVLTPLEKLRRKDQVIRTALADKQRLVADILLVPHADLEAAATSSVATAPAAESEGEKEARLLVVSAMTQASRLATVLNETLRLTEEEAIAAVSDPSPALSAGGSAAVGASSTSPRSSRRASRMPGAPTTKLLPISEALNRDLTQLLDIVSSRDEERENLRRELQKARDQLAELLVLHATPPASASSRPASHVSLSDCDTSTVAEPTEDCPIEVANNLILDSEPEVNEATNELLVQVESSPTATEEPSAIPDVIELLTDHCSSSEVDVSTSQQITPPAVSEEMHSTAPAEEKSDPVVDISESSDA